MKQQPGRSKKRGLMPSYMGPMVLDQIPEEKWGLKHLNEKNSSLNDSSKVSFVGDTELKVFYGRIGLPKTLK
ncbi:hypothetical protein F8388_001550 [Cannabis sativa]|uniref:Uncharacterized protein n=1 Tax=Cannabis sativa TaxID=3483 RepID=A0A7J6HIR7_CANSA|nr:hypothetical protein F8388_001550 [Cannabis sativa]